MTLLENMTLLVKATCARCGCSVLAHEKEVRPLCVDCERVEKMERRHRDGNPA